MRYLLGETSDSERLAVEGWASASPANAQELERMRAVWELGAEATDVPEVDIDQAWTSLDQRIAGEEGRGRVRPINALPTWTRWLSAAAVLAGLSIAVRLLMADPSTTYLAANTVKEVLLEDSSRVLLSPGTDLRASMGAARAMRLEGQAYFEVRRDEQRPFTVEAGDVRVTVLGTAFEVSAYDTADVVAVRVRSGRVRVEVGSERLDLVAGDHVRYNKARHYLERRPAPPAEVWGLRVLQFERAPLTQVVAQLERIYKVRITLANERLAACHLTAEFDDEPVDTILGVVAETFGLEVRKVNTGFELDGTGC